MTKRLWRQAGLPTPDFQVVTESGRAFAIGIVGGDGKAGVIGATEIVPPAVGCVDDAAPEAGRGHTFLPVETTTLRKQLFDLARRAYLAVDCTAWAWVDIRFDQDNQPYLAAIHPNPRLHPLRSVMPAIARYAGISYPALIAEIVSSAARTHHCAPGLFVCDVYLNDTKSVRGLGVFAGRAFHRGEIIARTLTGNVLPYQTEYSIQIGWDRHVEVDYPLRQMNHSCDPNMGVKIGANGFPMFAALRDIKPDEELTWDYAMTEYTHYKRDDPAMEFDLRCHCGAKNCRGKLGYYSELPEELKQKYAGFVADYLVQ